MKFENHSAMKQKFFFKYVVWGAIALLFFALVTMLLWNWLIPSIFNGPALTYFQALGLLLLTKLLLWGFGKPGNYGPYTNQFFKEKFYEKFSHMTPEQREAFKQRMKDKWCSWDEKRADKFSGTSND